MAITSLRRVGDLQALSVAPTHFTLRPAWPKHFYTLERVVFLSSLCHTTTNSTAGLLPSSLPGVRPEEANCMYPARALDTYVHRAALWRKTDQLLVCYGPPKRGSPASKQTLSRWIVEAINVSYESSGPPPLLGAKAHSTRGMAASKAFLAGVSMLDICDAAGWSTPSTVARFMA